MLLLGPAQQGTWRQLLHALEGGEADRGKRGSERGKLGTKEERVGGWRDKTRPEEGGEVRGERREIERQEGTGKEGGRQEEYVETGEQCGARRVGTQEGDTRSIW
jgi:hypothetical protein